MALQVRIGSHIGRSHLIYQSNKQDALTHWADSDQSPSEVIAVICDGCSEGKNSEVGARLASEFLVRETKLLLDKKVATQAIGPVLYDRLLWFLRSIVSSIHFESEVERVLFIKEHLLFTVIGLVVSESEALIFSAGDGVVVIDSEVIIIDQENHPFYPAYHLVDRKYLDHATSIPLEFESKVIPLDSVKKVAIASDGLAHEIDICDKLWEFKNPAGLQRFLNQMSKVQKRFQDDISIVTVEKVLEE